MFITLEGIEGSGKSTQCTILVENLQKNGLRAIQTYEPGWGPFGEHMRKFLLDEKELILDPLAELCLFCADRAHHVRDFITPKLNEGFVVVCDRFFDSTIAYQGYGRELDLELVSKLAVSAARGTVPDLTIMLDLEVEQGLERANSRKTRTKMEDEPLEFHKRVKAGFDTIAEGNKDRVKVVDASGDIESIAQDLIEIVSKELERK